MEEQITIVKNYRARVELHAPRPLLCELTGDDLESLKERTRNFLRSILNGTPKFEAAVGSPGLTLIYHPAAGETAIGYISAFDVPQNMSVQTLDQVREAAA